LGLGFALFFGLVFWLFFGQEGLVYLGNYETSWLGYWLSWLGFGLVLGLGFALVLGLGFGLLETRSVLITSRTPKEARSRSLTAALTWLVSGLVGGLGFLGPSWLGYGPSWLFFGLVAALVFGLVPGLDLALRNGGWFVLLQKVAHRRLARAGSLPSRPYDFLEWGIDRQIFRRVGGGVRFRHNLIQQHLASTSD